MLSTSSRLLALSRLELTALLAAFALSLPAVTPRLYSSDEIQYFSYLRSLWFDHDVSFENEYQHFYGIGVARSEGFHETFLERRTESGRRINFGTIGCALLWAPFYAAGDLVARTWRAAGSPVAADGFSQPYIAAVAYGSAFYGFLAVLLSMSAARRIGGPGVLAGALIWLGTPLLFYMYVAPPMSHACSAFAVALFVTIWLHVRRTWSARGAAMLGLSAALMAMVREQDAFLAVGPALDFVITAVRAGRLRDAVPAALAGTLAVIAGILPQLLAYTALNGHPGPSRLVTRKMSWHGPHVLEVLASPSHGFLIWTPLALLAIAGLVALAVRGRDEDIRRVGLCAIVMVAVQIWIGGSVESWTVAGAFGQRRFVALTILLTIGLSTLMRVVPAGASRRAFGIAALLCVWWNVALMAQFGAGLMDRQRLEPARNAYHAFVTLPRTAPALAWRYLTNRESFYERSGDLK